MAYTPLLVTFPSVQSFSPHFLLEIPLECPQITVPNSIPREMDLRTPSPTFINMHYFLQFSYTVFIFIEELNILDTMENTSLPLFLEKFAIKNSVCIIFMSTSVF